jgi:hypothetical protein
MATRPKKNPYSVHPGVAMVQKWIADLEAKSGRAFADWLTFVRAEGPVDEKAAAAWLKEKHGLGTFVAKWLAERAHQKEMGLADESPERYLECAPTYVDRQFQGKKAALRPIYDALLAKALKLGKDAKACPCETIVPLYRERVFAQLKATTNTRLDLGLALKAYEGKLPARLVDTGGLAKKDRITHRIELTSPDEIDAFVDRWLKTAYDLDAP